MNPMISLYKELSMKQCSNCGEFNGSNLSRCINCRARLEAGTAEKLLFGTALSNGAIGTIGGIIFIIWGNALKSSVQTTNFTNFIQMMEAQATAQRNNAIAQFMIPGGWLLLFFGIICFIVHFYNEYYRKG